MERIKKILIIGSKGMAGHVIFFYLKENTNYNVIDIARGNDFFNPSYQMDITNFDKLEQVLTIEKPDVVINCVGALNKDAEDHPDKAVLLNTYLPHFLAKIGDQVNFKLIHISTDCVFNGKKGGYNENSVKDGIGFYAQSKALGEVTYGNNITIRTSIIGPELKSNGIGLFEWFIKQTGTIQGYSDAYWTGVTTIELAKAINEIIDQDLKGLYHLVNDEVINKYELILLFKKVFKKDDLIVEKNNSYKVDKSLVKTSDNFNYQVPSYEHMIDEMKDWINNNKQLYQNKIYNETI